MRKIPAFTLDECRRLIVRSAAIAIAAIGFAPIAAAADVYPDRPIRIVVTVSAGVGNDVSTRLLAEGMQAELGQPLVVDNRPGADGIVAVRLVTNAPPDGYTLLSGLGAQIAINPVTYANPGYDPKRDLAPVSLVARQLLVFAVHPSLPVSTLAEFVAYTRSRPGTVNYGTGSSTFMLATESLKRRTGADMQHIPFNGAGPATAALIAGTVQASMAPSNAVIAHAQAGRIRVLAVSGASRLPQLPDVPTFAELGLPDDVPVWNAVLAPAGTPKAVVERLHAAIVRAVATPWIRDRFVANGEILVASTPDELAAIIDQDTARVREIVKAIGLPLN